ncbi:sugar phosphate isomerase/epimerase family protein [Streptomyces sp. NPDC001744]|uniref:sugar phosphate isomerase/epimerase family protein n=1 Tax=Streptomyces sp. NPDC001744 TaxID=3364606 RepID=UPI00367863BC
MPEVPPPAPPAGPAAVPFRPGLCSVTFRHLPVAEVARRAAEAGLEAIEWGADVHAPPGDSGALRAARDAAGRYGLAVCSYGSYFRCLPGEAPGFAEVARAAVALGAPRVRIWAGAAGSASVTEEDRARTTACLRETALIARDHGLDVSLEFHAGTLTDSAPSTVRLLEEAAAVNLTPSWQPPQDAPDEDALAGLAALAGRVATVHVFSWWPGNHRLPLAAREELWTRAFRLLAERPRARDALLEFVPGDDPAVLAREAATLRRAASAVGPEQDPPGPGVG